MPRNIRKISNSGIYHIIVRGINKQDIFYDNQDYSKFLKEIITTKEKYQYEIYSYCLMPNHVHMEIKDNQNSLEYIMRSLMVAYVSYFNKKYERIGHLFQDRFLSKQVETSEYILDLLRYIHQNPEKAGICSKEKYRWSSYNDYINKNGITDTAMVLGLFDMKIENFIKYNMNNKYGTRIVQEFEMNGRLTDEQAKEIVEEVLQMDNLQEIQKYNKNIRDEMLGKLGELENISCVQLARIIGISRKIIERAVKMRSGTKRTKMSQKEPSPMGAKGGKNGER